MLAALSEFLHLLGGKQVLQRFLHVFRGERGEIGELVVTTLDREGMPVLRYRTRDMTRFLTGSCPCGRVHRRIDRLHGRCDDMLIVKGVNIFPMQIEAVLMAMSEVGQDYQIVLERDGFIDNIRVRVEIRDEFFVEDMRALTALQKRISARLRDGPGGDAHTFSPWPVSASRAGGQRRRTSDGDLASVASGTACIRACSLASRAPAATAAVIATPAKAKPIRT